MSRDHAWSSAVRRRERRTAARDVFATFDRAGGRIGSGLRGSGQGGIGRCAGRIRAH